MDISPAELSRGNAGPGLDPAARAGYSDHPPRMGFFTDTSVCIGCKACEVPEDGISLSGMSYDNTISLGASTWRHVAFIEQPARPPAEGIRWLMSSDVCKHCTEAACLDVCPTGALFRTEFGTVVVQDDVCNGCGYCVPACPFGVIARREEDGGAHKCTLCYDRLEVGLEPACAKACPTKSIQFGPLDELRERAQLRVEDLHAAGQDSARLYLEDPSDGIGGRRTRWSPPGTCRACGSTWPSPRPAWPAPPSLSAWGSAGDPPRAKGRRRRLD